MSDINETDIDALLTLLAKFGWERYHATAKALVAERDALRKECNNRFVKIKELVAEEESLRAELAAAYRDRASSKSVLASVIGEREKAKADFADAWRERSEFAKRIDEADAALAAAKKRIAELEAQPLGYGSLLDREEAVLERLAKEGDGA